MKSMPPIDFSGLPVLAQVIIYGAIGLGIVFIYFIGHAGFKQGMKSSPHETDTRVAAMIVDPIPLRAATAAIEGLNMSMIGHNALVKDDIETRRQLNRCLDELITEIRVTREVNRERTR